MMTTKPISRSHTALKIFKKTFKTSYFDRNKLARVGLEVKIPQVRRHNYHKICLSQLCHLWQFLRPTPRFTELHFDRKKIELAMIIFYQIFVILIWSSNNRSTSGLTKQNIYLKMLKIHFVHAIKCGGMSSLWTDK